MGGMYHEHAREGAPSRRPPFVRVFRSGRGAKLSRLRVSIQPGGDAALTQGQGRARELAAQPRALGADAADLDGEVDPLLSRACLHAEQQRRSEEHAERLGQGDAEAASAEVDDGARRRAGTVADDAGHLGFEAPIGPTLVGLLDRVRGVGAEEASQVVELRIARTRAGVQERLEADHGGQEAALRGGHTMDIERCENGLRPAPNED